MRNKGIILLICAVALLSGCNQHKGWGVQGTINNAADGAKVAIEGFNAGMWYNIDSVKVDGNGSFGYVATAGAPYPDIYRVSLDGKSIYFPIDSLERIVITADADNFDTDYTVSGWAAAEEMMKIDRRIADVVTTQGTDAALTDSLLKRELSVAINDDESGILGYYIINKTIGGKPIFSPTDKSDLRVLGSLANKFKVKYPDDPRTDYLCTLFIKSRAMLNPNASGTVIEANEAGILEIDLYDANGQKQKLTDLAKHSGATILNFTSYQIDGSLAYNVELNRLLDKYKDRGLAIYQVSIDADELQWRNNAKNLPWTAVWYDGKDNGNLLRIYNVGAVPLTYIIDGNGDIAERVEDPTKLEDTVRKYLK